MLKYENENAEARYAMAFDSQSEEFSKGSKASFIAEFRAGDMISCWISLDQESKATVKYMTNKILFLAIICGLAVLGALFYCLKLMFGPCIEKLCPTKVDSPKEVSESLSSPESPSKEFRITVNKTTRTPSQILHSITPRFMTRTPKDHLKSV